MVGMSNYTLCMFLTALRKEENLTFAKKVKMRMGLSPIARSGEWRLYGERISSIVTDFDDYNPMDYLHRRNALLHLSCIYCSQTFAVLYKLFI